MRRSPRTRARFVGRSRGPGCFCSGYAVPIGARSEILRSSLQALCRGPGAVVDILALRFPRLIECRFRFSFLSLVAPGIICRGRWAQFSRSRLATAFPSAYTFPARRIARFSIAPRLSRMLDSAVHRTLGRATGFT